ncbi:MAG TPA: transglutaminase domain-containing protein [Verrucomicrobiae bacterium]|nr:transglutaminase domain-containing protein [Verrucomicrobiae bacterium]
MKRQAFIHGAAALSFGIAGLRSIARAAGDPFDPTAGAWRAYDVKTTVSLAPGDAAKVWIPLPSFTERSWMLPGKSSWSGDATSASVATDSAWGAQMLYAQLPASAKARTLIVTSSVTTRDRNVDLAVRRPASLSAEDWHRYTAPTAFIPTDGIVKATADKITAGATTDLEKAQRIYAWVVTNTYRNPKTRGCGLGNISFLLETGDFGGKCADLNGLVVGLARASGLPARDLYGIRVAPSAFGYKSLGANSATITKAQHCRAEIFVSDYGWIPADAADVRKVMLEEPPGNLAPTDPKVVDARETLFGAWEGNYMAYNDAHDVALPGSSGDPVPFLMYPQAEVGGVRRDSLDAPNFTYEITVVA